MNEWYTWCAQQQRTKTRIDKINLECTSGLLWCDLKTIKHMAHFYTHCSSSIASHPKHGGGGSASCVRISMYDSYSAILLAECKSIDWMKLLKSKSFEIVKLAQSMRVLGSIKLTSFKILKIVICWWRFQICLHAIQFHTTVDSKVKLFSPFPEVFFFFLVFGVTKR